MEPLPNYPGAGTGTHYWIDPVVGNNANPGTESQPWKTPDAIETHSFSPGDVIHFLPGTHTSVNSLNLESLAGSSSAWIGLVADGDVTLTHDTASANCINIRGCDYIYIHGFKLVAHTRGSSDAVKFEHDPSHHIAIESCSMRNGSCGIGAHTQYGDRTNTDIRVLRCEIYQCDTGIYWGYYETSESSRRFVNNSRIADNYIHHCSDHVDLAEGYGIQIKGGSRGNVIEGNVIANCSGTSRASIAVYHISTDGGTQTDRNIIRRNFILDSGNEGIYAAEGALIENNIIYRPVGVGINISPRLTFYGNITLRNNTVTSHLTSSSSTRCLIIQYQSPYSLPFDVTNNVLIGGNATTRTFYVNQSFTTLTGHRNACYGDAVWADNMDVVPIADPSAVVGLTYGEKNFMYPTIGSILINDGYAAVAASVDFNGTTRSQPDIGAYEFTTDDNPGWTLTSGFSDGSGGGTIVPTDKKKKSGCSTASRRSGTQFHFAVLAGCLGLGLLSRRLRFQCRRADFKFPC
jgi:hypothetical protein